LPTGASEIDISELYPTVGSVSQAMSIAAPPIGSKATSIRSFVLSAALAVPLACGSAEFTSSTSQDTGASGSAGVSGHGSASGSGPAGGNGGGSGSGTTGGTNGSGGHAGGESGDASTGEPPDAAWDRAATEDSASTVDAEIPLDGFVSGDDAMPADACAKSTFFLDGDDDGHGGTTTAYVCVPPTTGHWVTGGGDCDDSNPLVHPAQQDFFVEGYVKTGTTSVSFDYDCSGAETESASAPKANCHMQNLACAGAGYLVATPARSGPGVNPYCGSSARVACSLSGLNCVASAPQSAPRLACR
jgi:hypothetical protein